MSDLQPRGEALRKAVRFVSERLGESPPPPVPRVVDEATLRFDLSPLDAEFLLRFCRERGSSGGGGDSEA